jgi:hypothetical protein
MHRIYLAFLCFFRILFGRALPAEVAPLPAAAPPPKLPAPEPAAPKAEPAKAAAPAPKADSSSGALQLLGLLQREGRLVDFLAESIDGYDDASIGAAVRDIHKGCKKVLSEHFGVVPVMDADENEAVTVDAGFDPGRIRLVGNVAGAGPFKGTLRHHGWRAAKVALPVLNAAVDATIVAPAEVEL